MSVSDAAFRRLWAQEQWKKDRTELRLFLWLHLCVAGLDFSLYLIGIVVAIITGFLLKRTALKGAPTAFVMEIPPYHVPTIKTLAYRTWDRLKSFILKAGQLIVIIVAVLAFLNSLGTDGSFGN